jgi:hypothetical protein
MSIFGDLERFISEDLYPYRWPLTIAFAVAVAVFLVAAYRLGWHLTAWRHKALSAATAVVIIAVALPTGNYLLSPLWERSFLEEQSPLALARDGTPVPTSESPASPPPAGEALTAMFEARITHQGMFSGADDFHFGRGDALLIETAPGTYTLRFEEFSVRNGPDLFVYLTPEKESVDGAINLGDLKATDGAFNYEVPEGTDISQFEYAVVWCREFEVLFASAPLASAN